MTKSKTQQSPASVFLVPLELLVAALRAALKVAGKQELAFIRLVMLNDETIMVSAISHHATLGVRVPVTVLSWQEERDHVVDIPVASARALAGFKIDVPDGVEKTASVSICETTVQIQDEAGLVPVPSSRKEQRSPGSILPGNHFDALCRASTRPKARFAMGPKQFDTLAGVTKALGGDVCLLERSLDETSGVSSWYVLGVGARWQLSMTSRPMPQTEEAPTPDTEPAPQEVKLVDVKQLGFAPA